MIASIAAFLTGLANPTRFLTVAGRLMPWMIGVTVLLFAVGLYLSFQAPEDYQQGMTVRIMFIHVPSAWLAMMCYTVMAIAAIGTLVWRPPLADVAAKAASDIRLCAFPDVSRPDCTQSGDG